MRRKHWTFLLALALLLSLSLATYFSLALAQPPYFVERISAGANGLSSFPAISANGQVIAFVSEATNIIKDEYWVPLEDNNNAADIFVWNHRNWPSRVSVASDGTEANAASDSPAISADGRYVAFHSQATNLVAGVSGIFVHDRQTGETTHVAAGLSPSISGDGRYIAFSSDASDLVPDDTNNVPDVFVYDQISSEMTRVSVDSNGVEGNEGSILPIISADGRFVGFTSYAPNLVASDLLNGWDAFIHDRQTGETRLVSIASDGTPANGFSWLRALSGDGRYIAFVSEATNLVPGSSGDIFVYDQVTGLTTSISHPVTNSAAGIIANLASISADGRFIVFDVEYTEEWPTRTEIFIYDQTTGEIQLTSKTSTGQPANGSSAHPVISTDGTFIAYSSSATNLDLSDNNGVNDIFRARNILLSSGFVTPTTSSTPHTPGPLTPSATPSGVSVAELITIGYNGLPAGGSGASVSADGRYVAFVSGSNMHIPGDTNNLGDVFLRDRTLGETRLISIGLNGAPSNGHSQAALISADGSFIVFRSAATNLVPDDTNNAIDYFFYDRLLDEISLITYPPGLLITYPPGLMFSNNRRFVLFESNQDGIIPGDTNYHCQVQWPGPADYDENCTDIFVYDRQTGETTLISRSSDGTIGNNRSENAVMSADARFVAFQSNARNLVSGDTNGFTDVFVHDRDTGLTRRVSIASDGTQGNRESTRPSISADGRFVAFVSAATNLVPDTTNQAADIFLYDLVTLEIKHVSRSATGEEANDSSWLPRISANGRFIVFLSAANNLVPDDTNNLADVFVYDTQTGEIERAIPGSTGVQSNGWTIGATISADGSRILISTESTNLIANHSGYTGNVFAVANPLAEAQWPPTPTPTATMTVTPTSTPTPALTDVPALIEPADAVLLNINRPLFRWATSLGAVRYQLRLDTISPPAAIVYEGTGTRYTPPTPLIVGTYFWQVRALDGSGGSSAWSPIRSLTIQSPANAAPSLNYFTTGTPTLSWGRVSQAIAYEIQVDHERSFAAPLVFSQIVDGSTFEATITPALPDGTYFWRVRAQSANGQWRPWSAIDSFIVDVP